MVESINTRHPHGSGWYDHPWRRSDTAIPSLHTRWPCAFSSRGDPVPNGPVLPKPARCPGRSPSSEGVGFGVQPTEPLSDDGDGLPARSAEVRLSQATGFVVFAEFSPAPLFRWPQCTRRRPPPSIVGEDLAARGWSMRLG